MTYLVVSMKSSLKENPRKKKDVSLFVKLVLILSLSIGTYLVFMPFGPQIIFFLQNLGGNDEYYPYETDIDFATGGSGGTVEFGDKNIPEENWLLIPSIGIDALIVDGDTEDALDKGIWRRPNTSTPDVEGNTVLTAHRFKYLPPNNLTFYHLDKVRVNDKIIVYWEEIEYDYVVTEVFVVDPDRVDIEEESVSPKLTLYTCTPLWTADQRLVVVAEPFEEDN